MTKKNSEFKQNNPIGTASLSLLSLKLSYLKLYGSIHIFSCMLKAVKHIDVKGKKGKIISRAISHIIKEFDKRAHVRGLKKLDVYITKSPVKVCRQILLPTGKLKVRRHGEMREWVCGTRPNFSYWEKGRTPIIMLNANEKIFTKPNYPAVEGLFAHELMHLLNKLDGIENILQEELDNVSNRMFSLLDKHKEVKPFTVERLMVSMIRVNTTSSLLIKDVLANTRAMSFGFDEELYQYYKATLSGTKNLKYTVYSILKALKQDKKHVLDDAFLAYLGLNMPWISFKMFRNKRWKELHNLAKFQVPFIIKKNSDHILDTMLDLRSSEDRKTINKILINTLNSYYTVVQYFCRKLR